MRASSCWKNSAVFMKPPLAMDRTAQYTGEKVKSASDGDHTVCQVARMKEVTRAGFSGVRRPLRMQFTEQFDVVVVGAGHAGCEAAMAAARMGMKTALYTLNVDLIAQMSCNPAVGGIAKGHLVREVDALGGIMGEITDAVGIQFRLLNTSRGPAVWSPRAQCDKQQYRVKMREMLESEPNLHIKQAEVADLIIEEVVSGQWLVASEEATSENAVILSEEVAAATSESKDPYSRDDVSRSSELATSHQPL